MAAKLPSGKTQGSFGGKGKGGPRSQYQTPMAKGGSAGMKSGSKGRSPYQSLASSPKGRNAHT